MTSTNGTQTETRLPEIGDELAVSRALADLSQILFEHAANNTDVALKGTAHRGSQS